MDGQVSPASHRGPTDPPPGQEMAEGRRTRGWSVVGNEKGDSARLGDFTAALQRLLTSRLRPLGTALADASSYGQGHRGSQDHPQAAHCQVEKGKSRSTEAHASAAGGGREMVAERGTRLLQLSCCTRESPQPPELSARGT